MAMKYFKLHYDLNKMFKSVSDEQLGQGIRALLAYANSGEPPDDLELGAQIVFDTLSAQMDRDNIAYDAKCARNRENGKKGGRPKKANGYKKNQTVILKTEKSQEKEKEKEEEEEDIIINNNNKLCAKKRDVDMHFEALWKLYPNKKGKGQISDAKKKKLFAIGIEELTRAIDRYKKELERESDWRKPQNGSTFFNSGYVDYLDANYKEGNGIEKGGTARKAEPTEADYNGDSCGLRFV